MSRRSPEERNVIDTIEKLLNNLAFSELKDIGDFYSLVVDVGASFEEGLI